jgi:hypothetical protein
VGIAYDVGCNDGRRGYALIRNDEEVYVTCLKMEAAHQEGF